jgi:membrane-associated phospholipid phosphatase
MSALPPQPEPAARRSLRARLAGGPIARRLAIVDVRLYRLVRSRGRMPALRTAVRRFSSTGEHAGVWLALGVTGAAVDRRRRGRWLRGAGAVLATYLLNTAIKGIVRRKRPLLEDLPALIATPTQLSFPSAHASSSFAAARAYRGLLPAGPLLVAAATMGWSRVYLGVHYPSDIAAGALLGTVIGRLGDR